VRKKYGHVTNLYTNFAFEFAEIMYDTFMAKWLACLAYIAPVQDKPVVCTELVLVGREFKQLFLDFERRLAGGYVGAVADPEYMRVYGNRRLTECGVQDNVGGFAADAG
jgi:hypothetical protein